MGGLGMGAPNVSMDAQAFGRGFSAVTIVDVIVAHAPGWFSLLTGAFAGILLWSIPFALYVLNSAITWMSIGSGADASSLSHLAPRIPGLILGTGLVGLTLAWFRRLSARTKRYVTVGNMTVGFNTCFATVAGLGVVLLVGLGDENTGPILWLLGLGTPLVGYIVDGIWQMFHDRLVRRFGRPDMDALLSIEAEAFLIRHPGLIGFVFQQVSVAKGTAEVIGEWDSKEARDRVHQALMCIDGIDRVELKNA